MNEFDPELLREMHRSRARRRRADKAKQQHQAYRDHIAKHGRGNLVRIRQPDKDNDT